MQDDARQFARICPIRHASWAGDATDDFIGQTVIDTVATLGVGLFVKSAFKVGIRLFAGEVAADTGATTTAADAGGASAAKSAADVGPGINKTLQFGEAGRSGAGVKNFVGPQNSVVRGASQGRVFVTDSQGRVVSDITRDRVKPVTPGQGFVAGDGRKLAPTQQQLDWIDQLWGK